MKKNHYHLNQENSPLLKCFRLLMNVQWEAYKQH